MESKLLRYTLRVDRLYFQKFRYVAESEGRSANKEMEQFIKKRVNEFEKINGTIEIKKTWLISFGLAIYKWILQQLYIYFHTRRSKACTIILR